MPLLQKINIMIKIYRLVQKGCTNHSYFCKRIKENGKNTANDADRHRK